MNDSRWGAQLTRLFDDLRRLASPRTLGLGPAPADELRLPPTAPSRAAMSTPFMRAWRTLTVSSVTCLALAPALARSADGAPRELPRRAFTKDTRHSALTVAPGTLEFGVFSYARYAVNEHLELALHPVGFLLWPQLEAKLRWWDTKGFTFSTFHALSYPTWTMKALQREGTGGLIDPTVDIPTTVQMDLGLLATWRLGPSSWGTVQPFAQGAAGGGSVPVLEFPFLYQRLAAANAGWAVGVNAALEGVIGDAVGYEMSASYTHLPLPSVNGAFAVEALLEARIQLSRASTLPIGLRFTHARYPYGRRSHWFPYVDYRLVW